MTRLAALYGGNAPQRRTFADSRFAQFFDEVIYLGDLGTTSLTPFDGLVVPSRLHIDRRNAHGDQLRSFLDAGGSVITFGQQPDPWLPEVEWTHRPTNFWWWLDPDGDSGLRFRQPEHPFFEYVAPEDCEWHFHGSFDPPEGATVLITDDEGGAILYIDEDTWAGRTVVTTLDPTYHFGSYFMPATEQFLSGILPWLRDEFC
jgi:hypothetical protein